MLETLGQAFAMYVLVAIAGSVFILIPPVAIFIWVAGFICATIMTFFSIVSMSFLCNVIVIVFLIGLIFRLGSYFWKAKTEGIGNPITVLGTVKNVFIITFLQFLLTNLAMMRAFQQKFNLTGFAKLFRAYGEWFDTIDAGDLTILMVWFGSSVVLVLLDAIIVYFVWKKGREMA